MSKKRKLSADQMIAAINRHDIEALEKLLAQDGDPNGHVHDEYHGDIPVLLYAAGRQFVEGVKVLLKAGADPNARMTGGVGAGGGGTALHKAISGDDTRAGTDTIRSTEVDRLKIVDLLIQAGADVEAVSQGDTTPLRSAARGAQFEICQRLIRAGAKVKNWPNGCVPPLVSVGFDVPLDNAPQGERYEKLARLLIENGAPVDGADPDGRTALMGAAFAASERLVDFFLEHGVDVNHRAKDGRTPLICIAQYARYARFDEEHELALRITKRLLGAGADPKVKNEDGESAFDIASRSQNPALAEFIKTFSRSKAGKKKNARGDETL